MAAFLFTGAPLTAADATNGSTKASAVSIGQQTVTVQVSGPSFAASPDPSS